LVIAAYVLIVPANLMPVMSTGSLFGTERDTIFGGVVFLWTSGSQVLAMILFCASILIPIVKLISLNVSVALSRTTQRLETQVSRQVVSIRRGDWTMVHD